MFASPQPRRRNLRGLASTLSCAVLVIGFRLAVPAATAAGFDGGDGAAGGGKLKAGGGAADGGAETGAGGEGAVRPNGQTDLTTCLPGQVWDAKQRKCLDRHSGVLPDPELAEYAFALAKADRCQEAIDVLDTLENPNTPEALDYRGYATRRLGRTDEGIGYYLKSIALNPNYPQVREYLGEAYVIEGKFELAKDQLSTIEKLCGSKQCTYYQDLANALDKAHAL
jgi:tetratricopeptide (TPR) repeat protein